MALSSPWMAAWGNAIDTVARPRACSNFELACIVGILPRERIEPQPLEVALELGIDLDPCGQSGDLAQSIDYAAVDAQVRFLCAEGRFRLIEVLSVAILRLLLAPPGPGETRSPLSWARLQVRKPAVMRVAVPGVTLQRDAAWAKQAPQTSGEGALERRVLADVREVLAERVCLPAWGTLEGQNHALLLQGSPRMVPLPFTAEAPCTLLHVQARE